jgi:hypothetical protein
VEVRGANRGRGSGGSQDENRENRERVVKRGRQSWRITEVDHRF